MEHLACNVAESVLYSSMCIVKKMKEIFVTLNIFSYICKKK